MAGEGTALSVPSSARLTEQPSLAAACHIVCSRKTVVFMLDLSMLPA